MENSPMGLFFSAEFSAVAKRAFIALFVASLGTPYLASDGISKESASAYPYDLAFERKHIHHMAPLDISPDGRFLVYAVTTPPADVNRDGYALPSGTPKAAVGNKLYMTGLKKDGSAESEAIEICPSDDNKWYPVWSPDSRNLAFYADGGGIPKLWVYSRETEQCRIVTPALIKSMVFAGGKARWAPDSRKIYIPVRPDQSQGDQPLLPARSSAQAAPEVTKGVTVKVYRSGDEAISESHEDVGTTETALSENDRMRDALRKDYNAILAEVDLMSGKLRIVVPAEADPRPMALRISPSGHWISYLSVFNRGQEPETTSLVTLDLAVTPVQGGKIETLAVGLPNLNTTIASDYYSWHPTKDLMVFIRDNQLWRADFTLDAPSKIQQLGAGLGKVAASLHLFTPDGAAVVVGVDPEEKIGFNTPAPRALAVIPLDGGAPTYLPLDNGKWAFGGVISADDQTLWQPVKNTITLKVKDKVSGAFALLRLNIQSGAEKILWQGMARYDNLTAAGKGGALIGLYEDYRTPPDFFSFSTDFSRKRRLSIIEPRLENVPVGQFKTFDVTIPLYTDHLEKVHTTVLLPPRKKGSPPPPAIVMIYPQSDLSAHAASYGGGSPISLAAHLFVSRGFAVILPYVKIGPFGKAGHPVDEIVDALMPQVYRAAEMGLVDIDRLGLVGQSYGGYATAAIIGRTKLFKAAVSISGFYDYIGSYGVFLNGGAFGVAYTETGQGRMGGHPWGDLKRYMENSPYFHADKITTPLLIVKGEEDLLPQEASKLFNALQRFGRTAQLAMYAGEGHELSNWRPENAMDGARRMVTFYQKYLMNPPIKEDLKK